MNRAVLATGTLALGLLAGCGHGVTSYVPQLRAQGELTLRYDDGFSMSADGREVASGNGWSGLTEYVKCVPKAREHAEAAESSGAAATALSWIGAGIGLASLGSLAVLADYNKKTEQRDNIILTVGLSAAITGVVLAAIGRHEKPVANGHAVDAMNYYNDAVGSLGGTCKKPPPKLEEVEAQPPPKPEKKDSKPPETPKLDEKRDSPPPAPSTDI